MPQVNITFMRNVRLGVLGQIWEGFVERGTHLNTIMFCGLMQIFGNCSETY